MMTPDSAIAVREFKPRDAIAFRELNEEWIGRYFTLEPEDRTYLGDPQGTILDRGGKISVAVKNDEPIGCCALLALAPGEYEVTKMAVTESFQRYGIGRHLLERTIAEARAAGAHDSLWRQIRNLRRRSGSMNRSVFAICRLTASSPFPVPAPTFTWSCISTRGETGFSFQHNPH